MLIFHSLSTRSIEQFLRINDLTKDGQKLVKKFALFSLLSNALVLLSSTFFVLHIIDIVNLETTGLLFAIMFLTMSLTDYPSGNLVNKFGHNLILAISFLFFGFAYIFIAFADSFAGLLIIFLMLGVANSQLTGTLQSWFENNYVSITVETDPNKEKFREIQGRIGMIAFNSTAFIFVVSGFIAGRIREGRELVFLAQGIGCIILGFFFYAVLTNLKELKTETALDQSYIKVIKEELEFLKKNNSLKYFILAQIIVLMALIIFDILIVFPLYFGYTGSDFGAGLIRFGLFVAVGIFSGRAAILSGRLDEKKWLPRILLMCTTISFSLITILIVFFPIKNEIDFVALIVMSAFFLIHGFNLVLLNILTQKFYIDHLPDKFRNSIYSLIPSFAFLLATPVVYLSGRIAESQGLGTTMSILTLITVGSSFLMYKSMETVDDLPSIEVDIHEKDHAMISNLERNENFFFAFPYEYYFYDRLNLIVEELLEVAHKDGLITEDEEKLIFSILKNVDKFFALLKKGTSKGIISESQKADFGKQRNSIIRHAYTEAFNDLKVTPDEMDLIKRLAQLMHELELID